MVLTSIYTTDADVLQKAGANMSASWTDAMGTAAALRGESDLNVKSNIIWAVDAAAFAALPAGTRYILSDYVSSFIAKEAVNYDTSGYFAEEALLNINIQDDTMTRALATLEKMDARTIMGV